ncbi:MAG: hypothetical protein MUP33_07400 [Polaromonas sp.]|nr:hypothetical protein [Polaromonas sp.]
MRLIFALKVLCHLPHRKSIAADTAGVAVTGCGFIMVDRQMRTKLLLVRTQSRTGQKKVASPEKDWRFFVAWLQHHEVFKSS